MRIPFPDKPLYDLLGLAFLLAVLFGFGLGDRPYSAPSESRYIEIGREMAESGDFVTPRLNYVKYFEKPALFYWIQAESTKLFGYEPFAARVPTAIFAGLLSLLTYGLGRMLYGRLAGILGALIMATTLYLFTLSRIVLLDVPLSVFMVATLTAFLYATTTPPSGKRTFVIYAMYVAAAAAVMTKGLIGVVLPGAIVFLWLLFTKRWALLKEMRLITGTALFLVLAAPWYIMVTARNPEFPHFFFIHEHFQRYATREAKRYQPIWFFVLVVIAGLFPWIAFASQAKMEALKGFWKNRFEDSRPLFLFIWMAFIFVFFSISDSKLIPYVLPIFPPLCAMLGRYFASAWEEKSAPGFLPALWITILLLVAMAIVPPLLLDVLHKDNKVAVALAQGGEELHYLSVASMIGAGLLLVVYIQGRKRHVIMTLLVVAATILQLGDQVAAHYNRDSMQVYSSILHSVAKPGDEVAMYRLYYQDMPIYMNHRITIADWKGELEFGSGHEDVSAWMLTDDAFWKRWTANDHRMFVIMRRGMFERLTQDKPAENLHLYYIQGDDRNMLFMNRPPLEAIQPEGKKP